MPRQIVHLGSQVVLNFAVIDEAGNVTPTLVPGADGQPKPLFPFVLNISRLDHAAFEELEGVIAGLKQQWQAQFCPAPEESPPAPQLRFLDVDPGATSGDDDPYDE